MSITMDVPTKVILCLFELHKNPIRGKQFLVHQIFLVSKEVVPDASHHFDWYPYLYGPYSTVLAKRLNRLAEVGFVSTQKIKNVWTYSMTPEGQQFLNDHFDNEDEVYDLWEVQNLTGYDEDLINIDYELFALGSKKLKEWTRNKYPDFFSQTRE